MVRVKQTMQLKIVQGKYTCALKNKALVNGRARVLLTYFTTFIIYTPSVHHCVLVINLSVIFSLKCNRIFK